MCMQLKIGESMSGFRLIEEQTISEIGGIGRVFEHEKSGVRVVSLKNQDPHQVFAMGFQTLPMDETGAAHIVEHAVCCASKHYPLKETFVALGQGSICTTMNACTYPDMTIYYAASPHEEDLMGVAKVYLDLVFHPLIYENSDYFKQEGWHYHVEEDGNLSYSGVVYHEMEGEYAEAITHLENQKQKALFPDTPYRYDSGGLPEAIPNLTEEAFLAFHQKYYQGSNCIIILYGDGNLKDQLHYLNENGLQQVPKGDYKAILPCQEPFKALQRRTAYYPVEVEEEAETLICLSFVIGDSSDQDLRLSFEVLEHMLLRSAASPLLKTLVIEEELGVSLSDGGYDTSRKQPVFTITLKGCEEEAGMQFESSVFRVLRTLVKEGIPKDLIEASLQTLAFELKEVDASYEPIGIQYSEMVLSSCFYGQGTFEPLYYEKAFEKLNELRHEGYFETLIEKYLLNNPHSLCMTLIPSEALGRANEEQKIKILEVAKSAMTKAQFQKLIQDNKRLKNEQLIENTKEGLGLLPHLTKRQMPKLLKVPKLEQLTLEDCEVLIEEADTKDIAYIHFLFNARGVPQEDLPYLGILAHLFTYVGTETKDYVAIENTINTHTGGIHSAIHAYHLFNEDGYSPIFKVSCKVLTEALGAFEALMTDLFLNTTFKEKAKIKEALGHMVYEMERSYIGAPEYRSMQRLYTYFSEEGSYEDQVSGLAFYHFIKPLYEHFEEQFEQLSKALKSVLEKVIRKSNVRLAMTIGKHQKQKVLYTIRSLITHLPGEKGVDYTYTFKVQETKEAFCVGQEVQAIAAGFDFKKQGYRYDGSLEVISNILENTYLWDRVRLQGGAYGCEIFLSEEGYLAISSYCDPHLKKTLEVYEGIGMYLEQLEIEPDLLERYIVSTLGTMLAPISMERRSERLCHYLITHTGPKERQQIYDEILNTTPESLQKASQLFKAMSSHNHYCVIGNKETITKCKNIFEVIHFTI